MDHVHFLPNAVLSKWPPELPQTEKKSVFLCRQLAYSLLFDPIDIFFAWTEAIRPLLRNFGYAP